MLVVVGENDGLAEGFSTVNTIPPLHQFFQNSAAGILVEQVFEYFISGDVKVRCGRVFFQILIQLFLFIFGQVIIINTLGQHLGSAVDYMIADQILLFYGILQGIIEIGNSGFTAKNAVCIGIHLIFWRCSQTDKETVKVFENGSVTVENAAVCLIYDNQIKPSGRESLVLCIYVVDHCLIGAEHQASIEIFFAAGGQLTDTHIRHQLCEVALCLIDQRGAVCKEQDIFHPIVSGQHIHQRNRHTGFSGAGSHNQQATAVLSVQPFADIGDCHFLIWAVGYFVVDGKIGNITAGSPLEHKFQILHGMECHNRTIRVNAVNDFGAVTIGIVEDRLVTVYLLHALTVQIHLMASLFGVNGGLLDLNDGQRFAVLAIENVIAEAKTLCVGHSFYFDLNTGFGRLGKILHIQNIPTGLFQIQIDVQPAGGSFAHIGRLPIGSLRPILLGGNQANQVRNVVIREPGFLFADTSAVLGIHTENADIVEGIYRIRIVDVTDYDRAVNQFQQRGFGRLFCADFPENKVNRILQKRTAT